MIQLATSFRFIAFICFCACGPQVMANQTEAVPSEQIKAKQCVIVLHGMGRTAYSMSKLSEHLQGLGYTVWNEGYPSLSATVEELSDKTIDSAVKFCRQQSADSIHFVTHSLGGILLRSYLQEKDLQEKDLQENGHHEKDLEIASPRHQVIPELEKIVMLSPPNHGSEVVDEWGDWWIFGAVLGPAALQLGTTGFVESLQPIPGVIGIITGNESSDPWFSGDIPGPDDGKVSVESAKLEEMTDFLVMPVGHTFIMSDDAVLAQIEYFLKHGAFDGANSDSAEAALNQ